MTKAPRDLLKALFDAAVTRALPSVCVPLYMPERPKGRTVIVGAGKAAAAMAHKLKSSARSVGALDLGELCATIERIGKAGDSASLARLLPRFEQEFARVDDFLTRY